MTNEEYRLISKIAARVQAELLYGNTGRLKIDIEMDLAAAHEDVGLDLQKLLDADDANFGHDINGIARHLNRETRKLEGCFLPRCALPRPAKV